MPIRPLQKSAAPAGQAPSPAASHPAPINPPQRRRPGAVAGAASAGKGPAPAPAPEPSPSPTPTPTPTPTPPAEYDVGYAKPPRHSRFRPGQSGNPRGRPRQAKGLKTIIREIMTEKVAVRLGGGERKVSRMQAVVLKTVESALRGNPRAMSELLRLYSAAIPESDPAREQAQEPDLTETDLAILDQFRRSILDAEEDPS